MNANLTKPGDPIFWWVFGLGDRSTYLVELASWYSDSNQNLGNG